MTISLDPPAMMPAVPVRTTLLDDDADDMRLLEQVRPSSWQNPQPKGRYHLVVMGAGTGGLVAAASAAGLGARVALIERNLMGGDCLNTGCVPSKAVIRASRVWHTARIAKEHFGGPAVTGDGDFLECLARMRRLRADLSPIDGAERFTAMGVDVFLGEGRFVSPHAVEVEGRRLEFRRAVIATGAHATVPDIPGLLASGFYTNETIFSLRARPRHLVVVGGGPIGCELAQAFVRLGADVTILTRGERLLPRDSASASHVIAEVLAREGVNVVLGADVRRVQTLNGNTSVMLRKDGVDSTVVGDTLLVAVGRSPNVDDIGLDEARVEFDRVRGVRVDDRLRTTNARVYAVGDVCSSLKLTHAADFQARMVVQNALFFGRAKAKDLVTPWVTYTDPEVAHVGLTPESARQNDVPVDVINLPMHDVDRARLDGTTDGHCQVLVAAGTDRIVGASIVSAHAGEHISAVALAMTNRIGLAGIGRTMHPYPTQGEMLRKVADAWRRRKLTPTVKALFARYFRLMR